MEEIDILLTDEYVRFASAVAATHKSKKERQEEFKEVYDEFKEDMKKYDENVLQAQKEFEEWKSKVGAQQATHERTHKE